MENYYYAGGRKIALDADPDHVAIDHAAAEAAGLGSGVPSGYPPDLRSGIVLSDRSSLGEKALADLRDAGALRPVFRRDQATLVALPEVRVEFDNPAQCSAVKDMVAGLNAKGRHDVAIDDETDDHLTLKLASGNALDALNLANTIYEHAHPAASSVRFVQFVPKPGVKR
ncbi:MAG TPA: hypothetical protein PLW68_14440 [Casimicrobiaceae bacterium]|nr:hypothetical protein [Casimicrobiaceae bacterium]